MSLTEQEQLSQRGFLSIGAVLELIRNEFPDVTISKIRFLESQGLLNPERTPSGYRKFRAPDVERLRWILRQQREHFLPLKVIKDRLEAGTTAVTTLGGTTHHSGDVGDQGQFLLSAGDPPPVIDLREPRAVSAITSPGTPTPQVSAYAKPISTPTPQAGARVEPTTTPESAQGIDVDDEEKSTASGAIQRAMDRGQPSRPIPAIFRTDQSAQAPTPPPGAITREELLQKSSLTEEQVDELDQFGLLDGRTVGGMVYYDPQALVIAGLAAKMSAHGLGPRHLRSAKVAAEREAGLLQQVVLPLLRQRNPQAREDALKIADEMRQLSVDLHAALLSQQLDELLGIR